ncbi:MAG: hypothetical protein AAFY51_08790 [Pseudomonadota bacterium]
MIRAAFVLPFTTLALAGCSLFSSEDPRVGVEDAEDCANRVRPSLTYQEYQDLKTAPGRWVPTFTYDVTKMEFSAIQKLVANGADETVGTRLIQQTNRTATAVERFMDMDVSEKGAFFLGRKPALFRVRGRPQAASQILASGCERQLPDMRLINVSWQPWQPPTETDEEEASSSNENKE